MDFKNLSELDGPLRVIISEFHSNIAFDFNKLIFLGLRGRGTKELEEVMKMAASRDGYEGHKTFRYKEKSVSHFYIRFRNAACAEKAIVYFRAMDNKFNADIVKNILMTWYMVEKTLLKTDLMTSTNDKTSIYVDIQGQTNFPNPLSKNNVRALLLPFGYPTIIHSSETFPKYIQVLFSSMAEALAATIAVGGWFYYADRIKNRQSPYRVRIVGKSKEARIFKLCGSSSQEAFEMDYFVPASEVGDGPEFRKENGNENDSDQKGKSQKGNNHGQNPQQGDTNEEVAAESIPESN